MADLYLASQSPRRRDLLQQIHVRFEPLVLRMAGPRGADVDERQLTGEAADAYVLRVAREKALAGCKALQARSLPQKPVLTADTVVILDGDVLGKPEGAAQAIRTLRRLSGAEHQVHTAVAVALPGLVPNVLTSVSVSRVRMRVLDDDEIARYCATREPYDKAGGYGIQGLAAVFVTWMEGSYSGVMGLPLAETATLLAQAGIRVL
jgi:septum formation protein